MKTNNDKINKRASCGGRRRKAPGFTCGWTDGRCWPKGTRQRRSITAADLWRYLCRCAANVKLLEKARRVKTAKAQRRLHARLAAAEKRLVRPLLDSAAGRE
jgi:hypothetical protein